MKHFVIPIALLLTSILSYAQSSDSLTLESLKEKPSISILIGEDVRLNLVKGKAIGEIISISSETLTLKGLEEQTEIRFDEIRSIRVLNPSMVNKFFGTLVGTFGTIFTGATGILVIVSTVNVIQGNIDIAILPISVGFASMFYGIHKIGQRIKGPKYSMKKWTIVNE